MSLFFTASSAQRSLNRLCWFCSCWRGDMSKKMVQMEQKMFSKGNRKCSRTKFVPNRAKNFSQWKLLQIELKVGSSKRQNHCFFGHLWPCLGLVGPKYGLVGPRMAVNDHLIVLYDVCVAFLWSSLGFVWSFMAFSRGHM